MIIDMRVRPPFGTFLNDGILYEPTSLEAGANMFRCAASEAALKQDMALFIQEMDEAGIDKVVSPVRVTNGGNNEVVAELLKRYPQRIIGMAGINPLDDINQSLDAIDKFVVNGDFTGVNIEPGFTPTPYAIDGLTCDDRIIYPIYEKCQKEGKTVLLSFGGMCHWGLNKFNPEQLDRVCADFPQMKIIIAHGGYPYIPQVFWIAQRRGNLWIQPDLYAVAGSGSSYIEAAKYFLQGKILFGSAYPACPLKKAVELYQAFHMDKEIYEQVMGQAALAALGL